MRALVSGGNGFVGRHVVAALRAAGHDVRVLDRAGTMPADGVEMFAGDLLRADDLEQAFEGIDVLVHLAASMGGPPDEMVRNTAEGTRRLLEAMRCTATRRLVLASSFSVYDWAKLGSHIDEESPVLDEASARSLGGGYALAKTLQEQLTREFAERHEWLLTVLRPAVIWGGGSRSVSGDFLVGPTIGPFRLVFSPSALIRLVYVENAADAFSLAAARGAGPRELVLNVIDDPQVKTWTYAGTLAGIRVPKPYEPVLMGGRVLSWVTGGSTKLPYFARPRAFEALHKPVTWSNRALREALQWTPRYTFEQAIARTAGDSGGGA